MRAKIIIAGPALFLLMVALLAAGGTLARQGAASGKEQKEDATAFKEFLDRVQDYVKLHKSVEATLPPLKPKEELPEMITAHQQALARKIRQARPNAKPHDIFTKASHEAFQHAIHSTFRGPEAKHALATMQQGAPVKEVHLKVNEVYPDGVPHTSVPPTLLQKLPKLPDELEYCILGRDLILLDVRANLVVDLLKEILP
jgi:hypothetical protein